MELGFEIKGDREVALKFDLFPKQAHDALLEHIGALTARLEAMVEAAAPHDTGALAASITSRVYDNGERGIRGAVSVSADFAKAATLEYGSHRVITVNSRSAGVRARQGHLRFSEALARPSATMGAEFSRHMNIAEHRFLRGSLDAIEPDVAPELRAALDEIPA